MLGPLVAARKQDDEGIAAKPVDMNLNAAPRKPVRQIREPSLEDRRLADFNDLDELYLMGYKSQGRNCPRIAEAISPV
ncbi:MAG: hypothetical protein ACT4SY_01710 [Hyphomicrobiales bacterium]